MVSNIIIDSLEQDRFVIKYNLLSAYKESGLILSKDSLSLINDASVNFIRQIANQDGDKRFFTTVKIPENEVLAAYWFKIFYTDNEGKTHYSKVLKQDFSLYKVINKFIVKGPELDNNVGGTYTSLTITSLNNDIDKNNYSATINGIQTPVANITHYEGGNSLSYNYITFDIPTTISLLPSKLALSYKNKVVFTSDVTIVGGGIQFATKHPASYQYGAYFTYRNELYILNHAGNSDITSAKWNPVTNVWQKLREPANDIDMSGLEDHQGFEINGVIYFPPARWNESQTYNNGVEVKRYWEYIYSYTPATDTWQRKLVYKSNTSNIHMIAYDCFVRKNKLYSLINYALKDVIKEYNPVNGSWKEIMTVPLQGAGGHKTVILNDKVYILTELVNKQYYATTDFVNKFYQIDLDTKTMVEKHSLPNTIMGTHRPLLFTYQNKVYVYGGYSSTGYVTISSTLFASYDPITDEWSPVANDYNGAKVSLNEGFIVQLKESLYIGSGRNSNTRFNKNIYELFLK